MKNDQQTTRGEDVLLGTGHDWLRLTESEMVEAGQACADAIGRREPAWFTSFIDTFYKAAKRDGNMRALNRPVSETAVAATLFGEAPT